VGCFAGDVQGKRLDFFCMRRRMGTAEAPFASGCTCSSVAKAENEIGEGEMVCLWAEGKIVFLLHQCSHKPKPVYQTGPSPISYFIKSYKKNYLVAANQQLYITVIFDDYVLLSGRWDFLWVPQWLLYSLQNERG
jgi:hypothetical protein